MPEKDNPTLKRLGKLRDRRASIQDEIAATVRAGQADGLLMREMAKRLGMTRQGLYQLLDRSNPDRNKEE